MAVRSRRSGPPVHWMVLGLAITAAPRGSAAQVTSADSLREAYRLRSPTAVAAPEEDSLRREYRLRVPSAAQAAGVVAVPGTLAPGLGRALTGDHLSLYAGVSYTRFTRYIQGDHDAVGTLGLGFGDPSRWIGFQSYLGLYSTVRSDLFRRMGVSFEASRYLFWELLLTVGWENALSRGPPDTGESRYATLGRWFWLGDGEGWFSALALSGGVGDGRFVSEQDWLRGETHRWNAIGSMALQVASPILLLASWQGDDLFLGASINPFGGLVITPGVADATAQISTGARFVVSLGYQLDLRFPWANGGRGPGGG